MFRCFLVSTLLLAAAPAMAEEIDWPQQQPDSARLEFSVNRPGSMNRISVDLAANRASVQHIEINAWGVMHVLHTFSGTRANNPEARRDWSLTTLWVVAMDALAAGLRAARRVPAPLAAFWPTRGSWEAGRRQKGKGPPAA